MTKRKRIGIVLLATAAGFVIFAIGGTIAASPHPYTAALAVLGVLTFLGCLVGGIQLTTG